MSKAGNKTVKRAAKPRPQVRVIDDESALYRRIRDLILAARQTVARGVDLVQVHTNFEIGRQLVEHEQQGRSRAGYGTAILDAVADRLTKELGPGFSRSNVAYMRSFFLAYRHRAQIVQTLSGQSSGRSGSPTSPAIVQTVSGQSSPRKRPFSLGWSHYVFLLGIKNPDERSFYEIEATAGNWTLRELKRQFDTSLYERLALSRDKAGIRKLAKKGHLVEKPQDILKEPLVLEFLGLAEQARYSESDLESAIISQIERFLLEMGKGFLFEARQKRFSFDDDHFFVDLVFYNRLLRCYVLVDLKLGKLTHQDLGQMQMYVNYFDRQVRTQGENRTVGIVLCTKKNQALVTITLPKGARIHAREYQLYLPSKEVLQKKLVEWAGKAADA
jgi:predicted nuclease of restriction endonuclease-like (RecB) superfamily